MMKSICLAHVSLSTTGTATAPFPVPAAAPSWVCGGPATPPSPQPRPGPGTDTRGLATPPPSSSDRVPASSWGRLISPGQERMHKEQMRRKKDKCACSYQTELRRERQSDTLLLVHCNKTSTWTQQGWNKPHRHTFSMFFINCSDITAMWLLQLYCHAFVSPPPTFILSASSSVRMISVCCSTTQQRRRTESESRGWGGGGSSIHPSFQISHNRALQKTCAGLQATNACKCNSWAPFSDFSAAFPLLLDARQLNPDQSSLRGCVWTAEGGKEWGR